MKKIISHFEIYLFVSMIVFMFGMGNSELSPKAVISLQRNTDPAELNQKTHEENEEKQKKLKDCGTEIF